MFPLFLSLIISAVIFRLQKDNELDSIIRREEQKGIKKKNPKKFEKILIITIKIVNFSATQYTNKKIKTNPNNQNAKQQKQKANT